LLRQPTLRKGVNRAVEDGRQRVFALVKLGVGHGANARLAPRLGGVLDPSSWKLFGVGVAFALTALRPSQAISWT